MGWLLVLGVEIMAIRIGIAMDLEVRKWELEKKFKNTRAWRATSPFPNKKEAQDWQEKKAKELGCKSVEAGEVIQRRGLNNRWYGFIFEHDGPR